MKPQITQEQAENLRTVIRHFRKTPDDRINMNVGRSMVHQEHLAVCIGCHMSRCLDIKNKSEAIGNYYHYSTWRKTGALEKYFGIDEDFLIKCGATGNPINPDPNEAQSIFLLEAWDTLPADVFQKVLDRCEVIQ